jgi:two-component system, OmpR family, alkaline phosphatase synthesis response regulator PhoP
MSRILIVEDEKHLADGLRFNLEAEGYGVDVVETGEHALEKLTQEKFDLVVLDVMLPGVDGFTVAQTLRETGNFIPILMLTARGRAEDVLLGFSAGADDYIPKPFELAIFIARLRGLLRRRDWIERSASRARATDDVFVFNSKRIDFVNLELRKGDKCLKLTLMEADLLRYLIRYEGRTVSRKAMLEDVWGVREDTDTRAIDNFVVRLRRYIEDDPAKPQHLLTVRGVGYRFVAKP